MSGLKDHQGLPAVTRTYQNHHLDSTRWDLYTPRPDDIIITTAYKSGTTWTQDIFYELLYGDLDEKPEKQMVNVWPDAYFMPISRDELRSWLEGFTNRRYLKSHLPLDGQPYYPQARYVVVCRDPRDVFMSLFNHYSRYTDAFYEIMNDPEKLMGQPCPRCPEEPRELWQSWITRGWFEWESEGYPLWSNMHHTQSYWDYRALPNILFIHYNDMLADLPKAVRTLADFAAIDADDAKVARVVHATTFANVKQQIEQDDGEDPMAMTFKDGRKGFFFAGSNGRWKDILTETDLELYEAAKQRVLTPDCADYLERGNAALE
jgi:aryl sulfotransferase